MSDAFDAWLTDMQVDDLIGLGNQFGNMILGINKNNMEQKGNEQLLKRYIAEAYPNGEVLTLLDEVIAESLPLLNQVYHD